MAGKTALGHRPPAIGQTLAEINRLQTNRTIRDASGEFFIEGVRNFIHSVENNFEIRCILYSDKLLTAPFARKLVRQRRRAGVRTINLSPEAFREISKTKRASGVGAVLRQRWTRLEKAAPTDGLCWLLLDEVRSPGNLGTLIRTSEAVGGAGIITIGTAIDLYSPLVVRPSMGGFFRQRFVRATVRQLREWVRKNKVQVVGGSPEGATNFHAYNFPQATILALGDERHGLSNRQRALCSLLVRIPMAGQADSLNLGVAGSLLMYEVLRANKRENTFDLI